MPATDRQRLYATARARGMGEVAFGTFAGFDFIRHTYRSMAL